MHRLVGHLHMQRMLVGVRIDRDRLDPHLARRLDDPAGDLAPVGDQDLLEHARSLGGNPPDAGKKPPRAHASASKISGNESCA
jgi:hypothetical protein